MYEAQILISASRRLGLHCVSVPIESRYQCADSSETFRASHFKPWRDFSRITSHIVMQCLRRGDLLAVHRSIRANPALIDDPSGEFATAPLQQPASPR